MMHTILAAGVVDPGSPLPEWVQTWFDVRTHFGLWWLLLGLFAQVMFFGRWVIQWIASEKRRESHVPELFWWLSLLGATMLLVYFIGRREPIGVLGQSIGWIVYSRNLYLIKKKHSVIHEDVSDDEDAAKNASSP